MRSLLKGFHYGDYARNGEFGRKKRGPPKPGPIQQKDTPNYYGLSYSVYTATPTYQIKSNICK
jgi:hypothetical protein